MSRREREKKESLDALAKFAYSVSGGAPAPARKPQERAPLPPPPPPPPKPAPRPSPGPVKRADAEAARKRAQQLEARRAKLEEDRTLRERRAAQLQQNKNLEWRGMSIDGVPASIRRTGFDRVEPTVTQKIADVLGEAKEKEGRAKNREKGRRHGGGR